MIIDMHTHAGRPQRTGDVDRAVLATMRPAGVAAAVVSAIADIPAIRRNPATRRLEKVRDPDPGECLAAVHAYLDSFIAAGMRIAHDPSDIRPGDPALVLAVEGCDFLEGDLDRLDLMAAAATRPFICSHANLKEPGHPDGDHPRYIGPDYARMVVESGGVIGAWIAVLQREKLPGLIRHLFRAIDAVGIDHVGIGTDLPAGVARTEMPDFARHPDIVAAMRERGMTETEIEKVCSGNWLRVFRAVRG